MQNLRSWKVSLRKRERAAFCFSLVASVCQSRRRLSSSGLLPFILSSSREVCRRCPQLFAWSSWVPVRRVNRSARRVEAVPLSESLPVPIVVIHGLRETTRVLGVRPPNVWRRGRPFVNTGLSAVPLVSRPVLADACCGVYFSHSRAFTIHLLGLPLSWGRAVFLVRQGLPNRVFEPVLSRCALARRFLLWA